MSKDSKMFWGLSCLFSCIFFFAQLSGRHFSDDKVEFFFSHPMLWRAINGVVKYSSEMPEESVFLMWMQNMVYLVICYGDQSVSWWRSSCTQHGTASNGVILTSWWWQTDCSQQSSESVIRFTFMTLLPKSVKTLVPRLTINSHYF